MNEDFWKRKLAAFLHDPPTKQFDIAHHEDAAKKYMREAGFGSDEEIDGMSKSVKIADIWDSSLERFQFPREKCSHDFANDPQFFHPLSGDELKSEGINAKVLEDIIDTAIGGVDSSASWREKFFLYWRRWLENAATANGGEACAFLPADSRIPDHSIWVHNAMTSAFAGCIGDGGKMECEFLLFQFGPVQEFIAEARTTRDLFSGSYLLSWLGAHAMKAVTDEVGPDSMVFPSLRGNGIFDALHKDEIYSKTWASRDGRMETTWNRICEEKGNDLVSWLLNPTLPNRFFAVVPKRRGAELAKKAEKALRDELGAIAQSVWEWLEKEGAKAEWKSRFFGQVESFPQITWAVQSWLPREEALRQCENVSPVAARHLKETMAFAEETIPVADRDSRYYKNGKLGCDGILWSAHYAILNAKLAARRNTRDFTVMVDVNSKGTVKDSLSGKVDVIGDEEFWKHLKTLQFFGDGSSHRYGAMNIIKRLWCDVDAIRYLEEKLACSPDDIKKAMPAKFEDDSDPYLAVIAIDGDSMGKWISGENAPNLVDVLAPRAKAYVGGLPGGKMLKRILTPSYHLQFSEALSNFAIFKARSVVSEFGGNLIYAGGDDVLAIVPAKKAFACAKAVREAFKLSREGEKLYPGAKCDVSCGIAVGHKKAPLQMLVKEAQRMEGVAKAKYNRASVAVAVYKRSGEIIEWGTKWGTNAISLMDRLRDLSDREKLSSRFAYALAGLVKPYQLGVNDVPEIKAIVREEVRHVVGQQGANLSGSEREELTREIDLYLESLKKEVKDKDGNVTIKDRLEDFIGLFLVETFINRPRDEKGE